MAVQIMSDPERASFLNRLLQGTEVGRIRWEQGRDEFTFHSTIGRFMYVITSDDRDDVPPYTFRILSRPADDESRATPIAAWDWDRNGFADTNGPMQALYLTVKRTTLGLDRIVNEMLSDLSEVDGGPPTLEQSVDRGPSDW